MYQFDDRSVPQDALTFKQIFPHYKGANSDAIPREMRDQKRWLVWKTRPRPNGEKPEKAPYHPTKLIPHDSTDPEIWNTVGDALEVLERNSEQLDGIGFVLGNRFCVIDLDDCRNSETGEIKKWAFDIVKIFNSYTEISPSGCGLHIFLRAALPGKGLKKHGIDGYKNIEIYDSRRYVTVTGDHLADTPTTLNERQNEAVNLYKYVKAAKKPKEQKLKAAKEPEPKTPEIEELSDDEIIELASNGKDGDTFKKLYFDGLVTDYPTRSEADYTLTAILCPLTQSNTQVARLLRKSNLDREKFDRDDYIPKTILAVRTSQRDYYYTKTKLIRNNHAQVQLIIREALKELGFKKDHTRLINALFEFWREWSHHNRSWSSWFPARRRDLTRFYPECKDPEGKVKRDINKFIQEQEELRRIVINYIPGFGRRKKDNPDTYEGIASKFENHLLDVVNDVLKRIEETGDQTNEAIRGFTKAVVQAHIDEGKIPKFEPKEKPINLRPQRPKKKKTVEQLEIAFDKALRLLATAKERAAMLKEELTAAMRGDGWTTDEINQRLQLFES